MKLTALLLLFVTPALPQTPLTTGERDRAVSELEASQKAFLDSLAGVTDAQWNFKPSSEIWSIAECAAHIATSEDSFLDLIQKLARTPFVPTKGARQQDDLVMKIFLDRSRKLQAAETAPAPHWSRKATLVDHFRESRRRTIDFVRTTQDDLRLRFQPHPDYGTLDAYQWILFLSAHTRRHTEQLNEVKTDPRYPR
jgi:uncharacterized damage-inducible protein DinB